MNNANKGETDFDSRYIWIEIIVNKLLHVIGMICICSPVSGWAADVIDFTQQVLPIFKNRCLECHGSNAQESSLRVDDRDILLQGGESNKPAVVPGDVQSSNLLRLIGSQDSDERMPPDGEPLTKIEIEILQKWVEQGAMMPAVDTIDSSVDVSHWAFQSIETKLPTIPDDREYNNAIDIFILNRLKKSGLTLSEEANRRTLIRRLFLVVTGLAPSVADVKAFTESEDPHAYDNLVDRILASPQYGERWARHWLDVVRFGETNGFETNRERPTAWYYRDYVVNSLNADKPYDQFVYEQIAGDGIGTGFLVAGPHDIVKSPDINLTLTQRQDELADIVGTTGATFLGLTIGCARCHDHKFDPITQRDYYAIQAVFAGVEHGERALPNPPNKEMELARAERNIRAIRRELHRFLSPSKTAHILIDDATTSHLGGRGVEHFHPERHTTEFPARPDGSQSEHASGSGPGSFTWWKTRAPDEPLLSYRPIANGRFRIWLTWGVGIPKSSTAVHYVLDADGDEGTTADQKVIAEINQRRLADGSSPSSGTVTSSGPYDAGVHLLSANSAIILKSSVADDANDVVSADAILLSLVDEESSITGTPNFAAPVNPRVNNDAFEPIESTAIRFTILATNSSEPCIDELEVFSGDTNVALAANGGKARSSGDLAGYETHQLKHINDGEFGNSRSWISNENGRGWVQIDLARPERIHRVQWGRDRLGGFQDRVAIRYKIESRDSAGNWSLLSDSSSRLPANSDAVEDSEVYDGAPDSAEFSYHKAKLEKAIAEYRRLAAQPKAYIGTFKQPGVTHRLYRGEPMAKREIVAPDTIASLGSLPLSSSSQEQRRRREFANWMIENRNPLTARVIVNRLWQHVFGRGLVATPSDFGSNGIPPSHPELLDWLAIELVRSEWSLKHLQRIILTSATFRQTNMPLDKAMEIDASCELLWRFPPRRLEAEAIRDNLLAASGVLDLRMGGPGFSGFEVSLENVRHYFPKQEYGPGDWRRMIYMTKVRQEHDSIFGAFDCPDASQVMPQRSRSTTPLQALNLFNSRFSIQQAEHLAQRLRKETDSVTAQATNAFFLLYSRPPNSNELQTSVRFIREFGLLSFCRAMLNSNEFLFIP